MRTPKANGPYLRPAVDTRTRRACTQGCLYVPAPGISGVCTHILFSGSGQETGHNRTRRRHPHASPRRPVRGRAPACGRFSVKFSVRAPGTPPDGALRPAHFSGSCELSLLLLTLREAHGTRLHTHLEPRLEPEMESAWTLEARALVFGGRPGPSRTG